MRKTVCGRMHLKVTRSLLKLSCLGVCFSVTVMYINVMKDVKLQITTTYCTELNNLLIYK